MGCMQSADFAAQPKSAPKPKKSAKKKKAKQTQQHDVDDASQQVTAARAAPEVRETQPNPLTPPKAPSQSGQSACGSRSGRKPPLGGKPSASTRESAVGGLGHAGGINGGAGATAGPAGASNAPDQSQLGSKKNGGIARMLRSNEGGLNATKLGTIRMWIDTGDHNDLVDPQDVFGHERKIRRKLAKDFGGHNTASNAGEGSSYHDNGLTNNTAMTATQYSLASRY